MSSDSPNQIDSTPRFGLGYKTIWGFAALGTQLSLGVYGAVLPIYYQDYLGLAARWMVLASAIYAVWNAINDPLFGTLSDNTRLSSGRRVPYMRFTAPLLGLAFSLIWFPPRGASQPAIFTWMVATMVFYDAAYTIIGLVYSALLPEVTESDAERNELQISTALFGMTGLIAGVLVSEVFRPRGGSLTPFQVAMVIIGLVSAVSVMVTGLRVKERPELHAMDESRSLRDSLRLTLTSKAFLVVVAQTFMSTLAAALVIGSLFYLADYVLDVHSLVVLVSIFGPLSVGILATAPLRARFSVAGALQILLIVAACGLFLVAVLPPRWVPVGLALAGFGMAGPQTLTNVLYGQVADEDELRSGTRREGSFFGVNALLTKPAQSIALALLPAVLELGGFVPRGQNLGDLFADQPTSALWAIRIAGGLIPSLALILGAAILIWYPIRGPYLEQMKGDLEALHARKRARWERSQAIVGSPAGPERGRQR
jgi:GPH family glycoside/pentoside/hexuronide:cation symporter